MTRYATPCLPIALLATLALPAIVRGQEDSPKPSAYETLRDLAYRDGEGLGEYADEKCRLDLYFPRGVEGYDTVVWFHGGGLTGGERFVPGELRNRGVAVVAAGYRLAPEVEPEACIDDAAAAIAWTLKNIATHGGDPGRVFVSGHSAGGYLAAMVALDRSRLGEHGRSADDLAGCVSMSGHAVTHFAMRKAEGLPHHRAVVDDRAPLFHVRRDAPPLLLITGDRDAELWGRYEENALLWRMMEVAGHRDTELFELEGHDHGQMLGPSFALLLRFIERHSPGR